MHNSLVVNRLRIFTNSGQVAYDENFHKGVNIIRGENSSGKSTISHFLFYVLGGAFTEWTDEAKECSTAECEVELNGATFVLKRHVSDSPSMPMFIFSGKISDLQNQKSEAEWKKFSYRTTENTRSFSNILFDYLDIPIVYGDSNITMHQLLRLMYIDQDSPTNSLFLYEQFDTGLTRETVAELLLGVYNDELYIDRITKKEKVKKLEALEGEINGIKRFHEDRRNLNPDYIKNLIGNTEEEKNLIEKEIITLRDKNKKIRYTKNSQLEYEKLNQKVINRRQVVNDLENKISKLEYEIEDSEFFIETLDRKKRALQKSIYTRKFIQSTPFHYCPECLSKLETPKQNHCQLCKQEIDDEENPQIAKRMGQEISFQIMESKKLKEIKSKRLLDFRSELESQKITLVTLQKEVNSSISDVRSYRDEKIDDLLVTKGELEGLIRQYLTLLEIAEKYILLIDEKNSIEKEIKLLKSSIYHKEREQELLKAKISQQVEKFAISLLRNDLNREEGFKEVTDLKINYYDNSIYIDDKKKKFSASSMFYLKNVARFSIFFASLEIPEMRYPRFLLCDNMEDKGIEKERAQNFQKLIIETCEKYDKQNYQVIYTTSYLSDDLENSSYVVGPLYSETNGKTLKHVS